MESGGVKGRILDLGEWAVLVSGRSMIRFAVKSAVFSVVAPVSVAIVVVAAELPGGS